MSYCDLNLTFDLDSVKMFSTVIFQTYFSHDNDILIAATDYYLHQGDIIFYNGGHGGGVVTHSPPTSEIRVQIPA